jgi:hypothetical protein
MIDQPQSVVPSSIFKHFSECFHGIIADTTAPQLAGQCPGTSPNRISNLTGTEPFLSHGYFSPVQMLEFERDAKYRSA